MSDDEYEAPSIYENENYAVYAVAHTGAIATHLGTNYTTYYEALNKKTGVVELRHPMLPEVLHCAAQFNVALLNKAWEWHDKDRKPSKEGVSKIVPIKPDEETKH